MKAKPWDFAAAYKIRKERSSLCSAKRKHPPTTPPPRSRYSICTGEQVAGFQDLHTGHFTEVQLIRSPQELQAFRSRYGIPADCPIEKIY